VNAPESLPDVAAVKGDPLRDRSVLKYLRFAMKDGKVYRSELK
jgi:imidazolonepropionase-like amidohydrolase